MKKLLIVLLILVGAFLWTLTPATLDTSGAPEQFVPAAPTPAASMRMSVIHAGVLHSMDVFAYRGGEFGKAREFGMAGVLVRHPQGDLLIDTGFGREVDAHVASGPPLIRWLSQYDKEPVIADQFAEQGYDLASLHGVILTHVHWDHVSGLDDLRGVPVWVTAPERAFIDSDDPHAKLAQDLGPFDYRVYDFPNGPYENYASSRDVYGDGGIVIVPMFGHTPGSVGVFVNLPSGKRYFFVGDLVWAREAIDIPAERPLLARIAADHDAEKVRAEIVRVHALAKQYPDLVIVPAHDRTVLQSLPEFPGAAQ